MAVGSQSCQAVVLNIAHVLAEAARSGAGGRRGAAGSSRRRISSVGVKTWTCHAQVAAERIPQRHSGRTRHHRHPRGQARCCSFDKLVATGLARCASCGNGIQTLRTPSPRTSLQVIDSQDFTRTRKRIACGKASLYPSSRGYPKLAAQRPPFGGAVVA